MQKKKLPRANYRISHCSSEDAEYPAAQLLLQSPDAKGWVSNRFCSYPQLIILELVEPTIVKQISLLSHHSKIATKIQIQSKSDPKKQWKRLGYMSLESNANTNYQARELRTVKISDVTAVQMRFTLHTNYVNKHNLFNQVGIVSLCIFGDKLTSGSYGSLGTPNSQSGKTLGTQFDKNTMNKLRSLQIEKKQAVQQDDFQRAKQIKDQIQRIRNIGHALVQLEQRKQQAIRDQNFQDAKIINEKIKKLRDSNGGGPNISRGLPTSSNDYYRQGAKTPNYQEQQQNHQTSVSPITNQQKKPPKSPIVTQQKQPDPPKARGQPIVNNQDPDDRPIVVKNTNPYENAGQQEQQQPRDERQAELQPLNKELRGQCSQFFPVIDEELFRYVFSRSHANRQKGLEQIKQEIQHSAKNKEHLISAALFVVKSTIEDKVVSVLTHCLELLQFIMRKLKPQPSPHNMNYIDFILDKLADYLGHNTPAVKNIANNLYQTFPQYQITNRDTCYRFLTMASKRQKPPKVVSGRLKVLQNMVRDFQLGKNYQQVVQYAIKYVDDKNSQVRGAAMSLIVVISKELGYGNLQGYLKNVRPQILKSIEQRVGEAGNQRGQDKPIRPMNQQKGMERTRSNEKTKITQNEFEQPMQGDNEFIEMSNKNKKQFENPDYVCEFCQRYDKKFEDDNYRDLHLYNACPMITKCDQCGQAIEVASFTSHMVGECKNSKYFKKCPRCKEGVHQKNYKTHVQSKECLPAKAPAVANRCPLCHLDIQSGAPGWKAHLVDQGCDNNPRK